MIEYIATSLSLIICTTFMLISLGVGKHTIRKSRVISEPILNLIFFFAYYKIVAYYALPALLNIFTDYDFVRQDNINLSDLAYLYLIECISWLPWLSAFIFISKIAKRGIVYNRNELINYRSDFSRRLLLLWVMGYIYYGGYTVLTLIDNSYNVPLFLEIIKALLSYGGPPASIFLVVIGFRYWNKTSAIVGLVGSGYSILTSSTRGFIIYSIVFLLYLIVQFASSKKYYLVMAFLSVSMLGSYLLYGGFLGGYINIGQDGVATTNIGILSKRGDRSFVKEIEWRFGALTRYSTGFIKMYERGESAGVNPIKNSLLGFLPRSLNPEKPIPSTRDGDDLYSQGMYLINQEIDGEINGYTSKSMTEFSTGGHSYWEMGWFGVFVLNFISGLYIAICAFYFQRFGAIAIPLMVTLFKPWGYVDPKIWVSDIVMQVYQIILPIVFLSFFFYILRRWKRKRGLPPPQLCLPPASQ